jgi:hypothetical protein
VGWASRPSSLLHSLTGEVPVPHFWPHALTAGGELLAAPGLRALHPSKAEVSWLHHDFHIFLPDALDLEILLKAGGKCLFAKADVAIEEEIADLVRRTVEEFGRLDFAFNNACAAIIETDMTARIRGDEKLRGQFLALHPVGRFDEQKKSRPLFSISVRQKPGSLPELHCRWTAAHPHKPQKTARHGDRRDQTCTTSGGNPRGAAETGSSRQSKATPLGLAADYSARSGDALVWNSHRGTSVHDRFDG